MSGERSYNMIRLCKFTVSCWGPCEEAPGICAKLLILASVVLIAVTLPFSLCLVIKVVQEYEKTVIFRLGRILSGGARGPGVFFIIPCVDLYEAGIEYLQLSGFVVFSGYYWFLNLFTGENWKHWNIWGSDCKILQTLYQVIDMRIQNFSVPPQEVKKICFKKINWPSWHLNQHQVNTSKMVVIL